MNVPNQEKKAFRDMTPEERSAIVEALLHDAAEEIIANKWKEPYSNVSFGGIYRTRPRQLVIPWEHIKPEYKWAAMDQSGSVWVYEQKPEIEVLGWAGEGILECADALIIDTTGIDWRDSLVQRPDGV